MTPGLVAVDVDGTLVDRDMALPPARARSFAALVAAVPVMLATGKTAPSVADVVERFGVPGPQATCNGAALVHPGGDVEVLAALDHAVVDEVRDVLARRDVAVAVYLADGSIVTAARDPRLSVITDLGEPEPEVREVGDVPVLKVLAVLGEDEEDDLRGLAADVARVQRTGPQFLEWNAPDAAKGAAVRAVAERLGVAMADVVAIGDSENDVSMLEAAGHGIVVAHASDAAVAAADEHLAGDVDVAAVFARLAASAGRREAP